MKNILPRRKNDNLFKKCLEQFNSSQSYDLLEFIDYYIQQLILQKLTPSCPLQFKVFVFKIMYILKFFFFFRVLTCISLLAVVMHNECNQVEDSSNMVVSLPLILQYPCCLLIAVQCKLVYYFCNEIWLFLLCFTVDVLNHLRKTVFAAFPLDH